MARKLGLERLLGLLAAEIRDGVTRSLEDYIGEQFKRMEKRVRGAVRGPGRPAGRGRGRGAGRRVARSAEEIERRRQRILKIVHGEPKGISSKDVAVRMKTDARGVGKLLAGLLKEKAVKRDGDLYLPA